MFKEFFKNKFQDNEIKNIVCDILGNANLDQIESLICNLLQKHLQANVEEIIFLEPSAGAVFGFLLTNKQKVILKIYNKNISQSYLEKMNYIQGIFYGSDFPAPSLLSPIIPFNHTHAGFYEFLDGNKENGHDPLIIDELAKYLGRFSDIVDKHSFELIYSFMQESAKGKLWPTPHNVLFDFKKTSRGAGWITSKAIAAKKIINSYTLKKRLAHTDWDVKNTIFKNKKLVGVFDWDALGTMSEPEMVGRACAQFTADWESNNKITPTPEEGRRFIEIYSDYRGKSFNDYEYKVASASADYLIAMIARFEHAGGNPVVHPYQDLLKECKKKSFLFVK